MGTTRIKVIDLSSDQKEIKTSRKHAEKLSSLSQAKKAEKQNQQPEKSEERVVVQKPQLDQGPQTPENSTTEQVETVSEKNKEPEKTLKTPKTGKKTMHHRGAKYLKAAGLIEKKAYTSKEAFELLPQTSYTKFDPTVEAHLSVSEKNLKATVNMPHLKAEKESNTKYLIFGDKQSISANKQSTVGDQRVLWGDDKTIAEIENGTLKPGRDFTVVAASPKFMPKLAKVAKILGPKGLMPNPKNGTVTENFEKLFDGSNSSGGIHLKTDPTSPVIHTKIGKLSQKTDELEANFKALITAIGTAKIKKVTITTTMGPAIQLDVTKLTAVL